MEVLEASKRRFFVKTRNTISISVCRIPVSRKRLNAGTSGEASGLNLCFGNFTGGGATRKQAWEAIIMYFHYSKLGLFRPGYY